MKRAASLVSLMLVGAGSLTAARADAASAVAAAPAVAAAVRAPEGLARAIGFDQWLGAQVPLDANFRDSSGTALRLSDLLDGKPLLLVPNYYDCPHLCGVVRSAVALAIEDSGLAPGKDFKVVLVSMNPAEGGDEASRAQQTDAAAHPRAGVTQWNYLTGARAPLERLLQSVGFRYFLDARNGEYTHDAGLVVLTPTGVIAQYLFGVRFSGETLRLALVAASHGGIGTLVDHFLLLCCDYDASTGRYSVAIRRGLGWLALLTLLALGCLVLWLRRGEKIRRLAVPP